MFSKPPFTPGKSFALLLFVILLASCSAPAIPVTSTPTFSKFLPPTWTPTITQTSVITPTPRTPAGPSQTEVPTLVPTMAVQTTAISPGIFAVYRRENRLYSSSIRAGEEILLGEYPANGWITASSNGHVITYLQDGSLHNQNIFELTNEELSMPLQSTDSDFWNGRWAPDDQYLAYALDQVLSNDQAAGLEESPSIYLYSSTQNDFVRVTPWNTQETSPTWSPDGQWIAFSSDHAKVSAAGSFVGASDIFVLSTNCLEQWASCKDSFFKQITDTGTDGDAISPLWRPNSTSIGYIHIDGQSGDRDIYVTDLNGTAENMTNTPGALEDAFSWSPDGKRMVFRRAIPGFGTDLVLLDLESKTETNVTYSPAIEEGEPFWSPDGQKIAFERDINDQNSAVAIYSVDTQKAEELSNSQGSDFLFWLTVFPEISNGVDLLVSPAGKNLNLRDGPSMDGKILANLSSGDLITVLEKPLTNNGSTWWKVKHGGRTGWVVQMFPWYLPVTVTAP